MNQSEYFMKNIRFRKVENAMTTSSEAAPYLGVVETTAVVDTNAFIAEMISEGGCTESAEAILRVIQCGDNAVKACVGEQLMRVYTGDGTLVSPYIYGSFDAPDAPAGADNAIEPQIRLGAELRDALADIVPEENRTVIADLGGVRILSVLTEDVGFGKIQGTLPFRIAGMGFKPSAEATAAVSLTHAKTGVTAAADVVSVDSTQRINAKLAAVLPAGAYQLNVTVTEGSGADSRTRSAHKNVTVLAAETPPVVIAVARVTQTGRPDDTVLHADVSPCLVSGTGLALGTDDKVLIELYDMDGVTLLDKGDCTPKVMSSSDTEIALSGFVWENMTCPDGDWWNAYPRSRIVIVKGGVRCEHPITFTGE